MVEDRRESRPIEVAVLGVAVVAAAIFMVWRARSPLATAPGTATRFEAALASKDLPGLAAASSPEVYAEVLQQLSTSTWQRAQRVYYEVIPALAASPWHAYRRKANSLAAAEYERLRGRVDELGRQRFAQLSGEERMRLIENDGFSGFVVRAGLEALPPQERESIGDAQSFGGRDDRDAFVERRAWALLPAEDRAALGAAEALSNEETPAKLAFFDRVAIPLLSSDDQGAIAGYARPAVASLATFAAHYGEAVAKASLAPIALEPTPPKTSCKYPQTEQGSLLWPLAAGCDDTLAIDGSDVPLHLEVGRKGAGWRVQKASPELLAALTR